MFLAGCLAWASCTTARPPAATPYGDLETRVLSLEATNAKNAAALEFLSKVYETQQKQQADEDASTLAEDGTYALAVNEAVAAGQVDGPATAAVTIVKAFDFACPYCQIVSPVLQELVAEHKGDVRVVFLNFVVHDPAMPGHLASCAAAKQGKYLEFKKAFWDKAYAPYAASRDPSKLGEANIVAIARDLKLDTAKLVVDMGGPDCKARIAADMAELRTFKVGATPTFFVNGQVIAGALPKEGFELVIKEKLERVKASGVPAAEYYAKEILGKGEKQFRSKTTPRPR